MITADTFDLVKVELAGLPIAVTLLPTEGQPDAKLDFVSALRPNTVVAIGMGAMIGTCCEQPRSGIAVIQREGMAAETAASADIISTNIVDALDLPKHPKRHIATLRS